MNDENIIQNHYVNIVMNKPEFIQVNNSYERYCVYKALERYAFNWQSIWFNKSYKKEPKYAEKNTCKYCFRRKRNSINIEEWEHEDVEGDFCYDYYKCNTCQNIYASVWREDDFMFIERKVYKINIYYKPMKKMRSFKA